MIRHVIWDWNGTLLNDVAAATWAINAIFRRRGLPLTDRTRYRDLFCFPVRRYYERAGLPLTDAAWQAVTDEFHAGYNRHARDLPLRRGALKVLRSLRQAGIMQSMLSASEINLLHHMVTERGILNYFERIAGLSDFFAHSKESIGRRLMRETGLAPAVTVLIGDTVHDYEVAIRLGCRCILLAGGHQSLSRLQACGCPVVRRLTDLLPGLLAASPARRTRRRKTAKKMPKTGLDTAGGDR